MIDNQDEYTPTPFVRALRGLAAFWWLVLELSVAVAVGLTIIALVGRVIVWAWSGL